MRLARAAYVVIAVRAHGRGSASHCLLWLCMRTPPRQLVHTHTHNVMIPEMSKNAAASTRSRMAC